MGGRKYPDHDGPDEQIRYNAHSREADEKFRELMIRAGQLPRVVTAASTAHPRFTPHRAVPRSGGSSPAQQCAELGGNLQSDTTAYR